MDERIGTTMDAVAHRAGMVELWAKNWLRKEADGMLRDGGIDTLRDVQKQFALLKREMQVLEEDLLESWGVLPLEW